MSAQAIGTPMSTVTLPIESRSTSTAPRLDDGDQIRATYLTVALQRSANHRGRGNGVRNPIDSVERVLGLQES
jgi:hypothetical protein